jgi:TolB protein
MIIAKVKRISLITIACILCEALVCFAQSGKDQYEYIDLSKPFLRKIPLAIPLFKNSAGTDEENRLSTSSADFLSSSLEFTGFFKLLDRGAFLYDPQKEGILTPSINFQNWTVIGAELLITGLFEYQNGTVNLELRLFDTFKGHQIIGKKYSGGTDDQRKIILKFCGEVIFYLTGNRGMFESKIAFVSTGTGNKEIYICDFDGYNPQQLTRNHSITLFPAWSSDGNYLAYTSYKAGNPDLYVKNLSNHGESLIAKKGINITPAWAPGKPELAATLSISGDPEIYLLTASGKVIKRLTNMQGSDVSPSWSPDGKNLAFVSNRSGTPQIYIQDIVSDKARRLTFKGNYNTQPSWSPLGDKIVYSSMVDGRHNIFVIDTEGQEPVQLTADAGDNEAPTWSPDGSLIVFSSNREGPARLYVMNAFGTDQRRLLVLAGEQTNPKWSKNDINR